jgi:hypothetical protein
LYLTLENNWKVRVQEMDGTTKVTGNLLVSDLSSPFTPTLGAWKTQIILEAPLAAQAIAVGTIPALTAGESAALLQIAEVDVKVTDIYKDVGLDATDPVLISGDGVTSSVLTTATHVKTITPTGITRTTP